VLNPQWILPTLKVKWGLGHDGLYDKAIQFKHMFKQLLSVVYNTECLPVQSVCNIGCSLPKKNMSHTSHSTAVEGVRTIHLYSSFIQHMLKVGMRHHNELPNEISPTMFGAVKKRRREEAIAIQLHNMEFAKQMGWSSLTRLYDMRNAFYCFPHQVVNKAFSQCRDPFRKYFDQVVSNTISIVKCQDSTLIVHHATGIAPGLTCATEAFNSCYEDRLTEYYKGIEPHTKLLSVESVVPNEQGVKQVLDPSSTSFVDDLATTIVCKDSKKLHETFQFIDTKLDTCITTAGLEQNKTKAQSIAQCRGPGAHAAYKQLASDNKVGLTSNARYLGPHLHWQSSTTHEAELRVKHAWGSFYMYKKFWQRRVAMSFKKNVFIAAVVSTLLSGLVAFVLNGTSFRMLETCYFQMIRKVLGRKACNSVLVGGKHIYKQKSNRDICMLLRVPSFGTLLRVHRLQFFQSMLVDREHHSLYLATLYGNYMHDSRQDRPSNKWIAQYHKDIMALSEFDEMIWLCEVLDSKLDVLINNEEARDTFCRFDCKQLIAQEVLQGIKTHELEKKNDESHMFHCEQKLENGQRCQYKCATYKQLMLHKRTKTTNGHTQYDRVHIESMVVTNMCPFCETVLSSIASAKQHVRNALMSGSCAVDKNLIPHAVCKPIHTSCPICQIQFSNINHYHTHVITHFGSPDIVPLANHHGSSLLGTTTKSTSSLSLRRGQASQEGPKKTAGATRPIYSRSPKRQLELPDRSTQSDGLVVPGPRRRRRSQPGRRSFQEEGGSNQVRPTRARTCEPANRSDCQISPEQCIVLPSIESNCNQLLQTPNEQQVYSFVQGSQSQVHRGSEYREGSRALERSFQESSGHSISLGHQCTLQASDQPDQRGHRETRKIEQGGPRIQEGGVQHVEQPAHSLRIGNQYMGTDWRMEACPQSSTACSSVKDVSECRETSRVVMPLAGSSQDEPGSIHDPACRQDNLQARALDDCVARENVQGRIRVARDCSPRGPREENSSVPGRNEMRERKLSRHQTVPISPHDSQQREENQSGSSNDHLFFVGCEQFSTFDERTREMATAMIGSPINAIRHSCRVRGISDEGSRRDLIIKVCLSHNHTSRVTLGGAGNRDNT